MASSFTWLPSASRTTAQTSADISTGGSRNLTVTLDMTDASASPSVTLTIAGKDLASGKYRTLLVGAAVVSNTTNVYRVTQNIVAAAANASAVDVLPEFIRLSIAVGNANAGVYSVGYDLG
jgi:3-oxoacyl-[acyl-carrier-protein] synthase III